MRTQKLFQVAREIGIDDLPPVPRGQARCLHYNMSVPIYPATANNASGVKLRAEPLLKERGKGGCGQPRSQNVRQYYI
ncbi:MAG: hypothetical protein ACP5I8_14365 [Phycisphaerae bacterium]